MIHVIEMTQPQGHSTSGSHERYKSKDRLNWEDEHDCLLQMRKWMIESAIITAEEIEELEADAKKHVRDCQREAWSELEDEIKAEMAEAVELIDPYCWQSAS
jgi:TPP-dependent pyruvate/acetoin dehydrogenase alpha subunit